MNSPIASQAVEDPATHLSLEFAFRAQELRPEGLRSDHHAVAVVQPRLTGFLDDPVGIPRAFADRPDGPLEDGGLSQVRHVAGTAWTARVEVTATRLVRAVHRLLSCICILRRETSHCL
jgi:hypothetical protein